MTSPALPSFDDIAARLSAVVGVVPPPDRASAEYAEWSTTRLAFSAALLESAFTRRGWQAAYVGGGVLQFHLGGEGYQTGDLDMVVAQRTGLPVPRRTLDEVMRRLGGRPSGARHWTFGSAPAELLVEIPNHDIPLDTDRVTLPGALVLTMDSVEHVITGRIIEFHNTGNAEHALQAIHALRALRDRLDRERLNTCIMHERVSEAAAIVMALVDRPGTITVELLAYAHGILRRKRPWCDLRTPRCGPGGRYR